MKPKSKFFYPVTVGLLLVAAGAILFISFNKSQMPQAAAGGSHSLEIRADGTLWAWGNNDSGQLSDGTNVDKNKPVQIGTQADWQQALIAAGGAHSLAVKADGTLWAWGDNNSGQLGDGTNIDKKKPVQVGTQTDWQQALIVVDGTHSLAVKADGTLWAWGDNDFGQLGDGTNIDKNTPVQLGTAREWKQVAAGGSHSLAVKTDGTLWAWGDNDFGQLGDGTHVDKKKPVQVGTQTDWQQALIAAGGAHSLAVKADGTLWAWGDNDSGQLGDGTDTGKNIPAQIGTETNWKKASAGGEHNLAVKADGTLWAWGSNFSGQLGDGTDTDKNTPVQIGTETDWRCTAAGGLDILSHSLAMKTDGTLWGWGNNDSGQLGDGTNIDKKQPLKIITKN